MVIMETPKTRKLRRVKGSSKKKKHSNINENRIEKNNDVQACTSNYTPPRTSKSVIIERGQEEVRDVEWQYHRRFVESDIPIVWGSPHGSPVVNKVSLICESPVNVPRRKSPRIAAKVLNSDESEPPQFLNEILALSEQIKAEEGNNNLLLEEHTTTEKEPSTFSRPGNELNESFSNFFDEDGNECLLQYSQELEQASSQDSDRRIPSESFIHKKSVNLSNCEDQENRRRVMNSEISSLKKMSTDITSTTVSNKSSSVCQVNDNVKEVKMRSPRVGNKNYVHCKHKMNTYVFQGRVLGSRGNASSLKLPHNGNEKLRSENNQQSNKSSSVLKLQASVQKPDRASKSNRQLHTLDNSFETIKESFLNDDLEFLSCIPDDLDVTPSIENTSVCPNKSSEQLEHKQHKPREMQAVSSGLEDSTYFEEGVLQYLDTIESQVAPSQPLRCTPEEIERKRQEARMKLQKKKFTLKK